MSMPLSFTSAVSPVAAIPTPRAAAETATAAQPRPRRQIRRRWPLLSEHAQCAESVEYTGRRYLSGGTDGGSAGRDAGQQSQEGIMRWRCWPRTFTHSLAGCRRVQPPERQRAARFRHRSRQPARRGQRFPCWDLQQRQAVCVGVRRHQRLARLAEQRAAGDGL